MKRPGKPSGFYDLSHQTTDPDHGIITAVTVTPGDVHDSRPYLEQLEYEHVVPLKAAAADSAYDFPLAHGALEELGIDFFVVPQPAHDRTKAELKREAFIVNALENRYLPIFKLGGYTAWFKRGVPLLNCVNYTYDEQQDVPQRERTAAQAAVSRRQRAVLGILGGKERLWQLSLAAEMFE